MNRQTFIILAGGFVAALVVALLMQAMLGGGAKKTETVDTTSNIEILLAARALSVGDTLNEKDMKWATWPEAYLFDGAIRKSDIDERDLDLPLKGRLRRNVAAGEPLMNSAVVGEKGNFVAAGLADGKRAMAIKVKAESSVGGFILPGDYVDVIMTYEVKLPRDKDIIEASADVVSKKAVQTILQNIRVVAVDQEAKEIEETKIARTVSLEVTPDQSEALALAESMGDLSLALRKLGDNTIINDTENTAKPTTDIRMSNVMQELLGQGQTGGNNTRQRTVKIYNGATMEEISVTPSAEKAEGESNE